MCKVFKIKTKTGLVTTTTDQSIVRCLMDNYDDELTVTISKENKPIEMGETQLEDESETIQFNLCRYSGTNRMGYIKDLKNLLQITLTVAKILADEGGTVYRTNTRDAQALKVLLEMYKVSYAKHKISNRA